MKQGGLLQGVEVTIETPGLSVTIRGAADPQIRIIESSLNNVAMPAVQPGAIDPMHPDVFPIAEIRYTPTAAFGDFYIGAYDGSEQITDSNGNAVTLLIRFVIAAPRLSLEWRPPGDTADNRDLVLGRPQTISNPGYQLVVQNIVSASFESPIYNLEIRASATEGAGVTFTPRVGDDQSEGKKTYTIDEIIFTPEKTTGRIILGLFSTFFERYVSNESGNDTFTLIFTVPKRAEWNSDFPSTTIDHGIQGTPQTGIFTDTTVTIRAAVNPRVGIVEASLRDEITGEVAVGDAEVMVGGIDRTDPRAPVFTISEIRFTPLVISGYFEIGAFDGDEQIINPDDEFNTFLVVFNVDMPIAITWMPAKVELESGLILNEQTVITNPDIANPNYYATTQSIDEPRLVIVEATGILETSATGIVKTDNAIIDFTPMQNNHIVINPDQSRTITFGSLRFTPIELSGRIVVGIFDMAFTPTGPGTPVPMPIADNNPDDDDDDLLVIEFMVPKTAEWGRPNTRFDRLTQDKEETISPASTLSITMRGATDPQIRVAASSLLGKITVAEPAIDNIDTSDPNAPVVTIASFTLTPHATDGTFEIAAFDGEEQIINPNDTPSTHTIIYAVVPEEAEWNTKVPINYSFGLVQLQETIINPRDLKVTIRGAANPQVKIVASSLMDRVTALVSIGDIDRMLPYAPVFTISEFRFTPMAIKGSFQIGAYDGDTRISNDNDATLDTLTIKFDNVKPPIMIGWNPPDDEITRDLTIGREKILSDLSYAVSIQSVFAPRIFILESTGVAGVSFSPDEVRRTSPITLSDITFTLEQTSGRIVFAIYDVDKTPTGPDAPPPVPIADSDTDNDRFTLTITAPKQVRWNQNPPSRRIASNLIQGREHTIYIDLPSVTIQAATDPQIRVVEDSLMDSVTARLVPGSIDRTYPDAPVFTITQITFTPMATAGSFQIGAFDGDQQIMNDDDSPDVMTVYFENAGRGG